MAFLAFVHLALFLALSLSPGYSLVSSWCDHASFLTLTVSNSSLFTPALLRTHSFVFFAVHETRRILLSPFISKASSGAERAENRVSGGGAWRRRRKQSGERGYRTRYMLWCQPGYPRPMWIDHLRRQTIPLTQISGADVGPIRKRRCGPSRHPCDPQTNGQKHRYSTLRSTFMHRLV